MSPRTVNKYLPRRPRDRPRGDLRWSTFLRLHARGIIACDFLVAVTATFRLLYVFVVIEHRSRRLIHCNAHPSAAWTLQQLREAVGFEERPRESTPCTQNTFFARSIPTVVTLLTGLPLIGWIENAHTFQSWHRRAFGTGTSLTFIRKWDVPIWAACRHISDKGARPV
jgi:hypothetical protein